MVSLLMMQPMVMGRLSTKMIACMKGSGLVGKHMVKGSIVTQMAHITKVSLKVI